VLSGSPCNSGNNSIPYRSSPAPYSNAGNVNVSLARDVFDPRSSSPQNAGPFLLTRSPANAQIFSLIEQPCRIAEAKLRSACTASTEQLVDTVAPLG
jgi:hypothetical protein